MKNLAIICLLLIYTSSQVSAILIYYHRPVIHAISFYRQQRRLREQKEIIRDTIISKKVYLASLREKGEILLNGILHDIKSISFKNGQVRLQLLEDRKETNLMRSFSNLLNALHQQRPQQWQQQIWSWLFKVYPCDPSDSSNFCTAFLLTHHYSRVNAYTPSCFLSSPGKPPELNM